MPTEIVVPAMGESITQATVARWMKQVGDTVALDQTVVELETDKVTLEVTAPTAGTLTQIASPRGETVKVGAVLGLIEPANETQAPADTKAETKTETKLPPAAVTANKPSLPKPTSNEKRGIAGPAARKLAADNNLNLNGLHGTGPDGLVLKEDVIAFVYKPTPLTNGAANAKSSVPSVPPLPIKPLPEVKPTVVQKAEVKAPPPLPSFPPLPSILQPKKTPPVAPTTASVPAATTPAYPTFVDPADTAPAKESPAKESPAKPVAPQPTSIKQEPEIRKPEPEIRKQEPEIRKPAAPIKPAEPPLSIDEPQSIEKALELIAAQVSMPLQADAREERVRLSPLRQRIASRLKEAQNTAAILTTFNEVDMTNIMALRTHHKDGFEKRHGVKLGFMSFFIKASILALQEFPALNAEIDGDDVIYKNYYDIGVAIGTDQGLVVPIVRNANQLDFATIEKKIGEMSERARGGKLGINEMSGGTFTITNGGIYGSLMSTPILNPPQSGILGMHAIKDRPVAIDGKVEIRPMMYLALSYDHRLIDGSAAVTFLVRVKDAIENPERLLLSI